MSQIDQVLPAARAPTTAAESVYRKVIWRLMPYLLLACAINAIDRMNISFAKLRMAEDIALTDAAFGLGAGIFYLGYILFEVPSNLYMQRVGARATLTRIMMLWGTVTVATAFVTTPNQLIVARFFLGMAEAGFFPGVILYLTYWFPAAMRGRTTAAFVMAGVVAGIVSGPLAGWIMTHFQGWMGLRGWQVLFVFEGIPAVLLGIFGWFWLTDKPAQAAWLNDSEKETIAAALAAESGTGAAHLGFGEVLRDPRLYIAGLVCFCVYSGMNTASYWMPTLLRSFGLESLKTIGMVASLPYVGALLGMYLLGRSSDKRKERRWHLALTLMTGATCFFLLSFAQGNVPLSIFLLCLGTAGSLCGISLFWTIPPALLSPAKAAAGIAVISSIGNLAAALSQFMVGAIKSATGSLYLAFDVIAVVLVIGAVVLLVAIPAAHLREHGH
ncbi:MFS transporter [Massilia cavernae]|uniref:MFS transporter n=1 Tax=Massilia cavernae TaxID=2320864 RepID=A0A418X788_9BURK|nr:MFS transporter [Massilia cavernae]RJG08354.1 MFS transporter [Massilia cavernae]